MISVAVSAIQQWIELPTCTTFSEGPTYFPRLRTLCVQGHVQGGMVHDARIAALAQDNGVRVLYSADRDFSRFGSLKVVNPLVQTK